VTGASNSNLDVDFEGREIMQVLTVDIGTGTQDIYLFRAGLSPENGFKVVMPSPTMMVRHRIQEATRRGEKILLNGVTMGGGPSHWAAEDHLRSGLSLFATPDAARSFNDDLDWLEESLGITVVSEDEASSLDNVYPIELRDFDYAAIRRAFKNFGVDLDPQALGIAVFDHGAAPPDVSDRKFRFDHLRAQLHEDPKLSAFAYQAPRVPPILTRMQGVVQSARDFKGPLILMDTAPAAVLGATCDPVVAEPQRKTIVNIGNFHTLAFRLGPNGVEAVFEHHTGMLDLTGIEALLERLAAGTLTNDAVFSEGGHGALVIDSNPLDLKEGTFGVAVTGPRRALMQDSHLQPYFAVPFGDMMLTGCFGLLLAVAENVPELSDPILEGLAGGAAHVTPWDAEG
jgi:uncharacterized protein (DUF1786 family)